MAPSSAGVGVSFMIKSYCSGLTALVARVRATSARASSKSARETRSAIRAGLFLGWIEGPDHREYRDHVKIGHGFDILAGDVEPQGLRQIIGDDVEVFVKIFPAAARKRSLLLREILSETVESTRA